MAAEFEFESKREPKVVAWADFLTLDIPPAVAELETTSCFED